MNFEWSETQQDLMKGVIQFAKKEFGKHSVECDSEGIFSD